MLQVDANSLFSGLSFSKRKRRVMLDGSKAAQGSKQHQRCGCTESLEDGGGEQALEEMDTFRVEKGENQTGPSARRHTPTDGCLIVVYFVYFTSSLDCNRRLLNKSLARQSSARRCVLSAAVGAPPWLLRPL